jgi:hypothetical protein
MSLNKKIEEQFLIFFNSITDSEALAALDQLMVLGLSEQQIIDGIEAGSTFIKEDSIAKKLVELKRRVS